MALAVSYLLVPDIRLVAASANVKLGSKVKQKAKKSKLKHLLEILKLSISFNFTYIYNYTICILTRDEQNGFYNSRVQSTRTTVEQ